METKAWYQSKTIIGSLVTVIASIVGLFGIALDQGTQDQLTDIVILGITVVSGAFSIYGRIKATKSIQ